MARGRMLNATIAKDKPLNDLSIEAEYIYLKAIPHLDRDGLINGDPGLLWSDICPRRKELIPRMEELVNELIASGLVIAYHCVTDGDTVLFFRGFKKNQGGMRYDREAPSRFSPPPGYYRTANGLFPVDTADGGGQNDGGAPEECGQPPQVESEAPDEVPTNSGVSPAQYKDQDQVKRIEGEDHTRATEPPPTTQAPPSKTGDPYMDIAWAKHNGNKRFLSRRQTALMAVQGELPDLKLTPEQFTALVDCHLTEKGTKVLADSEGELADRELGAAQTFVIALCKVGRRFREVGGPRLVWESWRKHDKRKNPSDHQLLQHAAQMIAGQFEDKPAEKQTLSYKEWKIRTYACDNPLVIGIPEAQLRAAYEQAVRIH